MPLLGGKVGGAIGGWDRLLLARWVRERSKVSVGWLAHQLGMRTRGGMSNGIYLVASESFRIAPWPQNGNVFQISRYDNNWIDTFFASG